MAFNHLYDTVKWIFIGLWLLGNIALFGYTFWKYWCWDEFYYLRTITGMPIAFSRASASALNFNCCLILLPVCRNLISLLRGSCPLGRSLIWRHLDKNIKFHKMVGYTICFWTVMHFIGHTFNIQRFIRALAIGDDEDDIRGELSRLPEAVDGSGVNPLQGNHTNQIFHLVSLLPGWTGLTASLALILMVSSSTEFIRRNFFEVFWYTHHLFVVFFIVIIIHGFGGIVRGQFNTEEHDYHYCRDKLANWSTIPECPEPQFAPKEPETWKWVIGPMILYFIERLIRFIRRFQKVTLVEVVCHPSNVVELKMRRWGFHAAAGQYIFINCPDISYFQWHPFTLTSAPEDDYFSVHIRHHGDWTSSVAELCHCNSTKAADISQMPRFAVDGPFGTCSEDVFDYKVAVLVGAGIGVTPFASILKHIWYKHSHPGESSQLRKVYFYWVCSDTTAFEWFVQILDSLEEKMEKEGTQHFIDIEMYWTRGWNNEQREMIISSVHNQRDPITNLRNRTNFGRPNWENIFSDMKQKHISEKIGVFFCGPKEMSKQLHGVCNRHSSLDPLGTRFVFNKENF